MSKTRSTLIGSVLVAAIALSVPATGALAKGGDHGRMGGFHGAAGMTFEDFDLDSDGSLTKEELKNIAQVRFNKLDSDGDGQLSAAELEAAAEAKRAARFTRMIDRMDSDGNGTLSAEEMQAGQDKMRKGGKQGHEHARGKNDERGKDHRMGKRDGEHRGEHRGEMRGGEMRGGDRQDRREARGEQRFERMFALVDVDGNGTISKEEFDSAKTRLEAARGGKQGQPAPAAE
ncbi:EF-hand domain-containing protein [Marinovum sp. 2_MG-2023]|uniref:EF-hand domain-containing protein n=1 Tax=unclassified Marinovum TaxID=2647166 RepID=UPI0026E20822|nr:MULTISPECIES: EF-hand domain-containing protein [unclassified Marinovum]MDO6728761.1 EF-hand domain-containing protein [Marinovum sp. 2_MG-2023]MDO6777823.1 EF-hand domain-containing protein [Marinovum sp. 1_MG-2023]